MFISIRLRVDTKAERTRTPRHAQESVASTVGGEVIRYLEIIVEMKRAGRDLKRRHLTV
jgi:hypothetical protein